MATTPTQVRIDSDIKKAATELFDNLGIDMSSAVNMFLHQCVLRGGIPFSIEMPQYTTKTLEAMADVFNVPLSSLLEEGVYFNTFEIKPIVVPDSERFVKLIHYMPESDYQMVMEAFAKAEQRMKEEEGESE